MLKQQLAQFEEAANFASFQKLDNLMVYVDFNKIGATEWIKTLLT